MLLGLSGYARSGKDTVGQIIVEEFGYERRAFATKLYEAALALDPLVSPTDWGVQRLSFVLERLGWHYAKDIPEVRRTLQRLGTEVGRETLDPNVWIKAMHSTMRTNLAGQVNGDYVVTDVRYKNEAEWIKGRQGGRMLRINRPSVGSANAHSSETDLDDWRFNAAIDNDGTIDDLRAKVRVYMTTYLDRLGVK